MQENLDIEMADAPPQIKKKRIRRRMINGVLVNNDANLNNLDLDSSIQGVGEDCQCKRFRCFDVTTSEERLRVFRWFRQLGSVQMQDLYLSNLITAEGVKQRRPKITEHEPGKKSEHSASFFYKLKIPDADMRSFRELNVCRVAFLGILGISRNRLRTTQKMLYIHQAQPRISLDLKPQKTTPSTDNDMAVPEPLEALIISQIDGYALSETYSVKDMHKNFLRSYRINVPYQNYWNFFHAKWDIDQFEPKYSSCPTFDTFFETLNMFGLVDYSND